MASGETEKAKYFSERPPPKAFTYNKKFYNDSHHHDLYLPGVLERSDIDAVIQVMKRKLQP